MNDWHRIMLEDAKSVLEEILLDDGIDVYKIKQSIIDIETVINDHTEKPAASKEIIYKFSDYFPNSGPDGPRSAA